MKKSEAWHLLKLYSVACQILNRLDKKVSAKLIDKLIIVKMLCQQAEELEDYIIDNDDEVLAEKYFNVTYRELEFVDDASYAFMCVGELVSSEGKKDIGAAMIGFYRHMYNIFVWYLVKCRDMKVVDTDDISGKVEKKAESVRTGDEDSAGKIVKSDLPKALQTDEAVRIFDIALKLGLFEVVGRGRYRWMESKSLLGYFVDEVRQRLNLKCGEFKKGDSKYMIRPFEELFGVRQIGGIINDYKKNIEGTPVKHELVDAIME